MIQALVFFQGLSGSPLDIGLHQIMLYASRPLVGVAGVIAVAVGGLGHAMDHNKSHRWLLNSSIGLGLAASAVNVMSLFGIGGF